MITCPIQFQYNLFYEDKLSSDIHLQIVWNQLNFDNCQNSKTTVTFLNSLNIKPVTLKNGFHCTATRLSAGLQVTGNHVSFKVFNVGGGTDFTYYSFNTIPVNTTKFSNQSQKGLS